ncbi:hypothetical protein SLEP1_g47523 [Rubroshorea leprosula]|uniref:Uncharacterized protein n=1 Tax=Rubroshorea leprosula TaxID=152421 RepID=A0AAV5LTK0_9ROSI|nr:hypothetical protein SLEP1_g47523 [Rubroshorea leprosula]
MHFSHSLVSFYVPSSSTNNNMKIQSIISSGHPHPPPSPPFPSPISTPPNYAYSPPPPSSIFSFFMIGAQHLVAVAVNVENRASFVFIEDFRIDNNDSTI